MGRTPVPGHLTGLRKVPQQARSRARVEAICAAAERVLAADGVEALTMRRLSDEADVAIGTVYQFFTDKSAVLDAVVQRHMASFEGMLTDLRDAGDSLGWRELIDVFFDRYVERFRKNPAYVAIWVGHDLSPQMRRADDANIDAIASVLRSVLVKQEDLANSRRLAKACRVVVQTGDALLQLSFRVDAGGDRHTLAEARRILHLYLNDIVTDSRYHRRK